MKNFTKVNGTKKQIFNALIILLDQKSPEDITISDICKEAEIVRMSFYRHFNSKEDVILYFFAQEITEFIEYAKSNNVSEPRDILSLRFEIIKNSAYTPILTKFDCIDKICVCIRTKFNEILNFDKPKDEYLWDYITGGIDSVTKKWIDDDMSLSIDEVAEKTYKFFYFSF